MEQKGQVVKTEDGYAFIVVNRPSACGTSCESCHANCAESKVELIKLQNTIGAKKGESVTLETNSNMVLSYICLVYGMPLVFFIIGSLLTYFLLRGRDVFNQLLVVLGGVIFMAIAYLIVKKIDVNFKDRTNLVVLKR